MREFAIGAIGFAIMFIIGCFAKTDRAVIWSCVSFFATVAFWCGITLIKYINLTAGLISVFICAIWMIFCFAVLKHENLLRRKKFDMAQKLAESAEAEKNRM
ncbi:MAG: hypothetical protein LKE61_03975 [Erysipelotrichaceae bacterium]|jgi:hypothetical protein|nr:hypothetical protein [Erysipelotrichaceae bacterium]MCI1362437.1 hypothetical protein [Solobacterium sp.]MCH4044991.1 hypothetical protein [Erysipelotrichaceae bacterium]MCH4122203.1 hypothetical protein [Erysipelotrichaceae bacterium]MCI1462265.1 hypothetical protein [Solobacterium sp.]